MYDARRERTLKQPIRGDTEGGVSVLDIPVRRAGADAESSMPRRCPDDAQTTTVCLLRIHIHSISRIRTTTMAVAKSKRFWRRILGVELVRVADYMNFEGMGGGIEGGRSLTSSVIPRTLQESQENTKT